MEDVKRQHWPWEVTTEKLLGDASSFPKISIVTPSFNQGQYLEETILSVINQNYPNLEYIIIDGGSTDNSVEIIKKYEKHLKYWVSEKDKGQSDAINKGIQQVTGEVFNWLNSDDYYDQGVLHKVAEEVIKGAHVVCGRVRFLYSNGETMLTSDFPHSKNIVEVISSTKFVQQSTFFPVKFMKEVNGVNAELHYSMDFELWIKYLLIYGLSGVKNNDNIIANFRIHGSSKTFLSNNSFFKEWIKIFTSISSLYEQSKIERFNDVVGNYRFLCPKINLDEKTIKTTLSMFFYDALVFLYGERDLKGFDTVAELLNTEYLDERKRGEIKRMKFRRTFLPFLLLKKEKKITG